PVHQLPPSGGLIAEHVDLRAEIGFGPLAQEMNVVVGLFSNGGDGLIEGHLFRGSFRWPPGSAQSSSIEDAAFNNGNLSRTHDGHVLQQFEDAPLLGRGAVVELGGVNLRSQVEQDAYFVLKTTDQLVFREDHEYLQFGERPSSGTTSCYCAGRAPNFIS